MVVGFTACMLSSLVLAAHIARRDLDTGAILPQPCVREMPALEGGNNTKTLLDVKTSGEVWESFFLSILMDLAPLQSPASFVF